jgi:hypothetical protein
MSGTLIGEVTHFYNNISVAVISLTDKLNVGDDIHILGRTTDFRQTVKSLQIEHQNIEEAGPNQEIALKVDMRVRRGDRVYKLIDE